jgi:hypothetical protein
MIHALLDTTRVVASIIHEGAPCEVCAEATANHDRRDNSLTVTLSAYLRSAEHGHLGEHSRPAWLPAPETIVEHVAIEEAHEMTNDILASWCRRVTASVPHA